MASMLNRSARSHRLDQLTTISEDRHTRECAGFEVEVSTHPSTCGTGRPTRGDTRDTPPVLAFAFVDLEHVERELHQRLDALGPAPRAELLHVLMLLDFDRRTRLAPTGGTPRPA